MKKTNIILSFVCLLLLTGCGCTRKSETAENKGVQPIKLTSISIATGDVGFQTINIDKDGNETDVMTLDSTSNILVSTSPITGSSDYKFEYSNNGIVEIDKDYNIKPLKKGKTTITAKSTDGSNITSNKITIEVVE